MVKSNYTFEKRKKEVAKKKKKEDKRLKKLAATGKDDQADQADQAPSENDTPDVDGQVWSRRMRISLFPFRSGDFHMGFQFFHQKKVE